MAYCSQAHSHRVHLLHVCLIKSPFVSFIDLPTFKVNILILVDTRHMPSLDKYGFATHTSRKPDLSSPRVKRASPKGERASRARAATVSQCPHSEVGQDFLLHRRVTLTEMAVTRKRKV